MIRLGSVAAAATATVSIAAAFVVWNAPEAYADWLAFRSPRPHPLSVAATAVPAAHWRDDYFLIQPLGDGVFAIGEPRYYQCNFSYLIVGARAAVMFDAGPGLRDIGAVARGLTDRPIEALPSHLHFDHVGGLRYFAKVVLPDLTTLRRQVRGDRLTLTYMQHLGFLDGDPPPTLRASFWVEPGDEIDLGGRTLRVLSLPGHTPDSVALVDVANDRVFVGDFMYPTSLFAFLPGSDLEAYRDSARRLLSLTDLRTRIYGAHGCEDGRPLEAPVLAQSDLRAMEQALSGVLDGTGTATGLFPRVFPVNDRMRLLAKYSWMR